VNGKDQGERVVGGGHGSCTFPWPKAPPASNSLVRPRGHNRRGRGAGAHGTGKGTAVYFAGTGAWPCLGEGGQARMVGEGEGKGKGRTLTTQPGHVEEGTPMALVNARNEAQRRGRWLGKRLGKRQPSSRRRRGPSRPHESPDGTRGEGRGKQRKRGRGKRSWTTGSEAGAGELLRCFVKRCGVAHRRGLKQIYDSFLTPSRQAGEGTGCVLDIRVG
jgi:hypothetical protein